MRPMGSPRRLLPRPGPAPHASSRAVEATSPARPTRRAAFAGLRRAFTGALRASLVVLTLAASGVAPARAGDEPEQGTACEVPAFFEDDDATFLAAYDGLRRGLEEAQLPRVCRRKVEGDDAAAWERLARDVSAKGPAFVVVFGRAYGARAAAAPFLRPDGKGRIPCVYVDVASSVAGTTYPAIAEPAPPAAVVRGEVPFEAVLPALRRLWPAVARPSVSLAWRGESEAAHAWRRAVAAAGVDTRLAEGGTGRNELFLDAPLALGESLLPFAETLVRARAASLPVLSLDRGRFGKGAALVVASDAALVGRVAADAARRLRDGEGADKALRLSVRSVEVLLDLDAADAQGLAVPLPFVASADRVRWSRKPVEARGPR